MNPENIEDVIIIGAGAAGLCLAYELKQRGINSTILEQGDKAGWSWENMPEKIHLLSPWKRNHINGTKPTFNNMHKLHTCHEYAEYLNQYSKEKDLKVRTQFNVKSVECDEEGIFHLYSNNNKVSARVVINATGYFFNPNHPEDLFPESAIEAMHVKEFRSAKKLRQSHPKAKNILVVGGRISAGQTATELVQEGSFDVSISNRTEIIFSQEPWLQRLSFWFYYIYEDFLAKLKPHGLEDTNPPMEAGETKKLIKNNTIKLHLGIKSISENIITFMDNRQQSFDLIIYATGFNPVLNHLQSLSNNISLDNLRDFESPYNKNLYFIGLDNLVNFRSRYLRGLREDAIALAEIIKAKGITNEI